MFKKLSIFVFFCASLLGVVQAQSLLPQANLQIFPTMATLGESMTFDGSNSNNEQGGRSGLEYRFKVSSQQSWTDFSSNSKYVFTPQNTGRFIVQMEVRNTQNGRRKMTSQSYQVRAQTGVNRARIKLLSSGTLRVGEEVFFEIDLITPQKVNQYDVKTRWDFDSDGVFDTDFLHQKTASFVYQRARKVSPTAEVWFPSGEKIKIRGLEVLPSQNVKKRIPSRDWPKLNILPSALEAPIVSVSPGFRGASEDTLFRFDASRTCLTGNSWLEFHFDGDKIVRNKQKVSHKFSGAGNHEVLVRHCYNRKTPICEETRLLIEIDSDSTDYRVNFSAQNLSNTLYQTSYNQNLYSFTQGDRIRFTAQIFKADSVVNRFEYRWDFDGDGVFDTPFSDKTFVETTYAQAGHFSPKVEVKDEWGENKPRVFHQKQVIVVKNTKPTGDFVVQQILRRSPYSQLKKEELYVGEEVYFQVKAYDRETDDSYLKVRFDADGDGIWDNQFQARKTFYWQYEKAGTYPAKIQIQDHGKAVRTIYKKIVVHEIPLPKIKVKVSQKTGTTQTPFQFDARESFGHNLQFFWDIPGKTYLHNYSNPYVSTTFQTSGKKMIQLRVVDSRGRQKFVQFPVFVEQPTLQKKLEKTPSSAINEIL